MTVTALKPFPYQGRTVHPGEAVDVRPIEAAALTYRRLARFGGVLVAPVAATIDAPPDEPLPETRRRRSYRRRDLTAEDE